MAVSLHGNNGLITTNGTAAAPSLAAPDTDTGLYFGTNLIHASTDGTERLRITASGQTLINQTAALNSGVMLGVKNPTSNDTVVDVVCGNTTAGSHIAFSDDAYARGLISYNHANNFLAFRTNGVSTDRLHITSAGHVIIGGTSWSAAGSMSIASYGGFKSVLASGQAQDTMLGAISGASNGFQINTDASNNQTYTFHNGSTVALRIDSNSAIRNVTAARGDFYNGSYDAKGLHLEGVSGNRRGWISLVNNSNNSGESVLMFGKTRGTSAGAVTIVAANDDLGVMHFSGSDGVDLRRAAEVRAQVEGTPAVNKVGGRLMFYTTANTTDANPTERLRIDSSGNLTAVNTTAGATTGVTLKVGASASSGTNSGTIIINNGGLGNASLQFDYEGNAARAKIYTYRSTNDIIFDTSGTEKYRFKDTGEFHISDRNSATVGEHVFQAGSFGIRMQDTGGYNRWNIERNYGGWQSTPIVHLSAQGRVGINQASPGSALNVKAIGSASDGLQVTSSSHSSYVWQIQNNDNLFNGSLAGELGIRGSSGISFSANAGTSTHFRITSAGQVRLPVNGQELAWGASQQFRMYWENSEDRMYLQGAGAYGIAFRVNNGNRLEINKTTGDVTMQGASGRNFNWDNSDASLYLTDSGSGSSARLKIGTGQDLQLYHDVGAHTNHITCASNGHLKISTNTLQVYEYTGNTKKFEVTNRGKILSYHQDTSEYGASDWARTGSGNQGNASQAHPEGSMQFQSNTGYGTMRYKSYIQSTDPDETNMYITLYNSGFYRITVKASHNSQLADVGMWLVYGLNNISAKVLSVANTGNFTVSTQNTHVNSHDTTLKITYGSSTNQGMRALVEVIGGF